MEKNKRWVDSDPDVSEFYDSQLYKNPKYSKI